MTDHRRRLDGLLAEHALTVRQARDERASLKQARQDLEDAQTSLALVQQVAEQVQTTAHAQLAGVVTRSLETVFPHNPYEFVIRFEKKRNRTEAVLTFARDGHVLENPLEEAGGGCVDVAALALRMSCLLLERPAKRRLLCFDEPFRNVNGAENRKRAAALLLELAKELGVQIILSTGYDWLRIGKVIDLEE